MPRFVAFLRAINVGGCSHSQDGSLTSILRVARFFRVETFIASGNVVFKTRMKDSKTLERKIEKRLLKGLGYDVAVFIRTGAELIEIANYKPFRESKMDTLTACNIVFLADALDKNLTQKVLALGSGTDEFRVYGRQIYWLRRRRQGVPFSTVPLEKALGRPFTVRACNTIERIVAKYYAAD